VYNVVRLYNPYEENLNHKTITFAFGDAPSQETALRRTLMSCKLAQRFISLMAENCVCSMDYDAPTLGKLLYNTMSALKYQSGVSQADYNVLYAFHASIVNALCKEMPKDFRDEVVASFARQVSSQTASKPASHSVRLRGTVGVT
jgi:hypothetical protein